MTVPLGDTPTTEPTALAGLANELREALAPGLILLEPLGGGGMGVVFLARDPALKRTVVVKVLLPELAHNPSARARFAREAESAAAVSHPNVVGVFQVGELPRSRTAYFVMQHVDGVALTDACPAGAPVPAARAGRIVGEIASALAAAHARGLVHRDIKPANVMLERGTDRVIVLDFGISAAATPERRALAGTRLTQAGTSLGTPAYMSPEQAAAEDVTDRSDVYSLGVVAFELLAGRLPFTDTSVMALAAAHIKDTPPALSSLRADLDPSLDRLVARMLAKTPTERPGAAEVARALLPAAHAVVEWPPPGLERVRGQLATALRWQAVMLALTAVLIVLVGVRPSLGETGGLLAAPLAALVTCGAITVAVVVLSIAFERVHWARGSGYPLGVAIDVALDTHADTGLLVSGVGRYAAIGADHGRSLVARRRLGAVAVAAGEAISIALLFTWAVGVPWLPDLLDRSAGLVQAAVLFLPALLGGSARWALAWHERTLRHNAGPVEERRMRKAPPVAPTLVSGWLASAGVAAPRHRSRRVLWLRRQALEWPSALLGLAVMLVVMPLGMSAVFGPPARPRIGIWDGWRRRALEEASAPGNAWRMLDSLLKARASLGAAADTAAARAALTRDPRAQLDPDAVWEAFELLPGALPGPLRARLEAATGDLTILSGLASSGPLPTAWFQGRGALDVRSSDAQTRLLNRIPRRGLQHAAAAALALAAGNRAAAQQRAHEIIAVGRLLALDPVPQAHAVGLSVVDLGARLLREIAVATGDRTLLREAEHLREAVVRRRQQAEHFLPSTAAANFRADRDTTLVMLARLRSLAPSDRWRMVQATALGACWEPDENRRGPSLERRELLAAAGAAVSDIPRSDEWAAGWNAVLDDVAAGRLGIEGYLPPFMRWVERTVLCEWVRS